MSGGEGCRIPTCWPRIRRSASLRAESRGESGNAARAAVREIPPSLVEAGGTAWPKHVYRSVGERLLLDDDEADSSRRKWEHHIDRARQLSVAAGLMAPNTHGSRPWRLTLFSDFCTNRLFVVDADAAVIYVVRE